MKRAAQKKVRGILVDKVDEKLLEKKLEEMELEFDTTDSLASKIGVFADWMDAQFGLLKKTGGEIGQCEKCMALCDLAWPSCPVCGTSYDDDAAEPPVVEPENKIQLVEELDTAVVKLKQLVVSSMSNYHQLGRHLIDVFRSGLYKARTEEGGKPKYKSWDEFVETEVGLSGVRSRTIMDVADQFTEEQVIKLGVEKLRIVARFDAKERDELIEKAETMSTRALMTAAAEVRQKVVPSEREKGAGEYAEVVKKHTGLALGTEAAKKAREEKKEAVEEMNGVTAVFQMGEYDLELFKTGKTWTAKHVLVNDVVCKLVVNLNSKPPKVKFMVGREKDA